MHSTDSVTLTIAMFALEAIAADQTVRIIEVIRVTINTRARKAIPKVAKVLPKLPVRFYPDVRRLPEWPISEAICSCCVVVDE